MTSATKSGLMRRWRRGTRRGPRLDWAKLLADPEGGAHAPGPMRQAPCASAHRPPAHPLRISCAWDAHGGPPMRRPSLEAWGRTVGRKAHAHTRTNAHTRAATRQPTAHDAAQPQRVQTAELALPTPAWSESGSAPGPPPAGAPRGGPGARPARARPARGFPRVPRSGFQGMRQPQGAAPEYRPWACGYGRCAPAMRTGGAAGR